MTFRQTLLNMCVYVCVVQIVASGVCHTDWTYLYDCEKGVKTLPFPLILGHEAAGVVESVGPGVTAVQPGTLNTHTC